MIIIIKKRKMPVAALLAFLHHFWLVNIMKYLFVEPLMIRLGNSASQTCTTLFFLTPPLIGSINIKILILTNRTVALMGLIKLNKMIESKMLLGTLSERDHLWPMNPSNHHLLLSHFSYNWTYTLSKFEIKRDVTSGALIPGEKP